MQRSTKKNRAILTLILLFIGFSSISQDMMFEVSLRDQITNSSKIVEGKVISKNSFWDVNRQNIYTINTIEVYKVFKGPSTSTLDIITEGGIVDMTAQVTSLSLDLSKGEMGVFMLHESNIQLSSENTSGNLRYESYSAIQGFYKYDVFENSVSNPYLKMDGISQQFYDRLTALTQSNFIQVTPFDIDNYMASFYQGRAAGTMAISTFSPPSISGGTRSVLTIDGAGFGETTGSVSFRDANSGGSSFFTALQSQIISWSDTQIQVEVPSRAGTGTFRVFTSDAAFINSPSTLQIPFSEINVTTSTDVAYPTQHVNDSGSGGYIWTMNNTFFFNNPANLSFRRAFDTWRCETGIKWDISGSPTSNNTIALDNTNIIRFDVGTELPNGVLGRNTSYFSGCTNGNTLDWYISELDIVFNDTSNWNYGTNLPSNSQIDFETVAVHELGHGHQLAHVINSNAIMHFAVSNGVSNRVLSANDILGGNDVQSRSTTNPVCGRGLMTNHNCSLGVDENELSEFISIYPNPAKNEIFIKNNYNSSLDKIELFDVTGRSVKLSDLKDTQGLFTLNTSDLSQGIYLIKINVEGKTLTKKMVIE